MVDFNGVSLPFGIDAMLGTVLNFVSLYAHWIVLVIGIIFSPVLYGLALRLVTYAANATAVDHKQDRQAAYYKAVTAYYNYDTARGKRRR